jgi:uncharacterized membrane protein
LFVLGSIGAGLALSAIGTVVPTLSSRELPSALTFSPEGSRAMLSAIATSMITVAGVAFSITVVALSLSSQQYSPRVLRQFMRDRANQWVLGILVGIFAYCLAVLPSIHGQDGHESAPSLAVIAAIVYALLGVGCLVFFIHHVATAVQASHIVAEIAEETRAAADAQSRLDEPRSDASAGTAAGQWHAVAAPRAGYLQLLDEECIFRLACRHDALVRTEQPVGAFLVDGTTLVSYRLTDGTASDAFSAALLDAFIIRRTRTIEQDVLFGIRQIVDVALRALSPSLNDPTTASLCVNYLTAILRAAAVRTSGDRQRTHRGTLRLIIRGISFRELLAVAFAEIRFHATSEPAVLRELLVGLRTIGQNTSIPENRAALHEEVQATWRGLITAPVGSAIAALVPDANAILRDLQPPASASK